jgi:hypothetical protein
MDPTALCPRNKHDFERVNALIAAGPKAAEPILPQILQWLQDFNWPIAEPIAEPIADFLVSVGEPLIPHLRKVLTTNDDMWIYWTLQHVVSRLPSDLVRELEPELCALVHVAENDIVALRIIAEAGIKDRETLLWMVKNKLNAVKSFAAELKALQAQVEQYVR